MGKVISAHSLEVAPVREHSSVKYIYQEAISSRNVKETKKGQGLTIPFLSSVTTKPTKLCPLVTPPSRAELKTKP